MFGQPSEVVAIDFWTFVPDVLKRVVNDQTSGRFVVRNETIAVVRRRMTSRSAGSYYAEFHLPSDDRDLASGILVLCLDDWDLPKLILLVGHPDGFGEYKWHGVCPTLLKPVQMLFLDPATHLFVSRKAVGKPPPISVQRINDDQAVVAKLIQKYGLSNHPDLSEDLDFAPFGSLVDIFEDAFFASNGLPSPIRTESGATNVLATVQNYKERQRLPPRLLKKDMAKKLARPFRTKEEFWKAWADRRLPHPSDDFFKAIEAQFAAKGPVR